MMLIELRKVIPSFLTRVDQPDRGGAWSDVPRDQPRRDGRDRPTELLRRQGNAGDRRTRSRWCNWDPDAEDRMVASMLYPYTDLPDDVQCSARVKQMSADEKVRGRQGLRRRSHEPSPPARPRARNRLVPLRPPHRLRRVPRPAAPPHAHHRVAAAVDRCTATTCPSACRRGRPRHRLRRGDGALRRPLHDALLRRVPATRRATPCRWPTRSATR